MQKKVKETPMPKRENLLVMDEMTPIVDICTQVPDVTLAAFRRAIDEVPADLRTLVTHLAARALLMGII